ncbi:Uncharacterised protein [Vibrio cholerae]|nr:Uncharacterised protein [Vibrio cholerae]
MPLSPLPRLGIQPKSRFSAPPLGNHPHRIADECYSLPIQR